MEEIKRVIFEKYLFEYEILSELKALLAILGLSRFRYKESNVRIF